LFVALFKGGSILPLKPVADWAKAAHVGQILFISSARRLQTHRRAAARQRGSKTLAMQRWPALKKYFLHFYLFNID
jgi:hypothetical protein